MTKAFDGAARPMLALLAASASAAQAALPSIDDGGGSAPGLFQFGYMGAYDYILLAVALIAGVATGFLYYRSTLLDSVRKMQKPSKVKLRALGLGLAAFALILMLSPSLPIGVLMILAAVGLAIAMFAGLGLVAAVVVVVIFAILLGLWFSGVLGNMLAG